MMPFTLPKDFLLGAATSATQIEGGDDNNSWYRWSRQPGRIKDGSDCFTACDHWNRVDEDTALFKKMRLQTYRLGIEWSRIEPAEGKFDRAALKHYRDEIAKLRRAGIVPLVTLHHFSNPLWLEDRGAWLAADTPQRFERYAAFVTEGLADLVSDWITINEPNIYLLLGYIAGIWPPGEGGIKPYLAGARSMIDAHIRTYRAIHDIRARKGHRDTRVGVAHHLRVFDPASGSPLSALVARAWERIFQDMFLEGMATGRLTFPAGRGYPFGRGSFQDFLGINYYSRDIVRFAIGKPGNLFGEMSVPADAPRNDLGWEIYPEGLYRLCKKYYDRYRVPIYITENGTCDARDAFRARYLYDHLLQVSRLIADGVDVQRYYHWSIMDNFEWAEGLSGPFGLVAVNFKTQKRTIRPSGEFYREIIAKRGVTKEMIIHYL